LFAIFFFSSQSHPEQMKNLFFSFVPAEHSSKHCRTPALFFFTPFSLSFPLWLPFEVSLPHGLISNIPEMTAGFHPDVKRRGLSIISLGFPEDYAMLVGQAPPESSGVTKRPILFSQFFL